MKTTYWIVGITTILLGGVLIYKHYNKKEAEEKKSNAEGGHVTNKQWRNLKRCEKKCFELYPNDHEAAVRCASLCADTYLPKT